MCGGGGGGVRAWPHACACKLYRGTEGGKRYNGYLINIEL